MRRLWRLFWSYVPHRCRFGPVYLAGENCSGRRCSRCGTAVYFDVEG